MDESVVREFEQQQVGKLKLSQAIRLGCKLGPKATGHYWKDGGYCALGAAWVAATGRTRAPTAARMREQFGVSERVLSTIARMNDTLGYTREQIADWLEKRGK